MRSTSLFVSLVGLLVLITPWGLAYQLPEGSDKLESGVAAAKTAGRREEAADAPDVTATVLTDTEDKDDVKIPSKTDLQDAEDNLKVLMGYAHQAEEKAKEASDAVQDVLDETDVVENIKEDTIEAEKSVAKAEEKEKKDNAEVEHLKKDLSSNIAKTKHAETQANGSSRPLAEGILMAIVTFIVYRSTMQ